MERTPIIGGPGCLDWCLFLQLSYVVPSLSKLFNFNGISLQVPSPYIELGRSLIQEHLSGEALVSIPHTPDHLITVFDPRLQSWGVWHTTPQRKQFLGAQMHLLFFLKHPALYRLWIHVNYAFSLQELFIYLIIFEVLAPLQQQLHRFIFDLAQILYRFNCDPVFCKRC